MSERYTVGPVAKNATSKPPAGNWTRDPGSLVQCSTGWTTELYKIIIYINIKNYIYKIIYIK